MIRQFTQNDAMVMINKYQSIVNFGSSEDAPSDYWIKKAEEYIQLSFSKSYKWFLKEYGGGDICGEEIFSLYEMDFETAVGGDIIYNYIMDLKDNFHDKKELVISRTDFGEEFFFNYKESTQDECPIYVRLGLNQSDLYAVNFYDFLCRRIQSYL